VSNFENRRMYALTELPQFTQALCCEKSKAVTLHAMEALGGSEGIAPTHSRPRH
jgi:hypothetical protein